MKESCLDFKRVNLTPDEFAQFAKENTVAAEKKNWLKAVRLFLEMNDVVLNWKKIRRMLPTIRRYALDSVPTLYVVWWTNRSGNWEVMFRASTDGGQTFGDKINLSNSTDAESQTAEILAVGEDNVLVSWWETSAETWSSESVLRVSTDGGQTFGPMIMLGVNGTIITAANTTGVAEGEEAGEETMEEEQEAVGGLEVAE